MQTNIKRKIRDQRTGKSTESFYARPLQSRWNSLILAFVSASPLVAHRILPELPLESTMNMGHFYPGVYLIYMAGQGIGYGSDNDPKSIAPLLLSVHRVQT